jgi:phage terminase small subunit
MLTPKRQTFATSYALTGNGVQSAIEAGYAPGSAHVEASRLLRVAKVAAAIDEERARLRERSDLKAQDVIDGLRQIAEDESARNSDRIRAYELLGKHLRLFTEQVEVQHSIDDSALQSFTVAELRSLRETMTAALAEPVEAEARAYFGGRFEPDADQSY